MRANGWQVMSCGDRHWQSYGSEEAGNEDVKLSEGEKGAGGGGVIERWKQIKPRKWDENKMEETADGEEVMGKQHKDEQGTSVHQTDSPQVYLSGSCHC